MWLLWTGQLINAESLRSASSFLIFFFLPQTLVFSSPEKEGEVHLPAVTLLVGLAGGSHHLWLAFWGTLPPVLAEQNDEDMVWPCFCGGCTGTPAHGHMWREDLSQPGTISTPTPPCQQWCQKPSKGHGSSSLLDVCKLAGCCHQWLVTLQYHLLPFFFIHKVGLKRLLQLSESTTWLPLNYKKRGC